jgi:site-specific recombinase XerD
LPVLKPFIFTTQINNDHTRKSYLNATRRFAEWCELHRLHQLADVQPFHVAVFVKDLQGQFSPPTVKQHLAAIRMLFDWLVTGHVIDVNPAHAVRGPKYVVKKGKTPVLNAEEARALLDSIDISTLTGLRDRALIGVMVYTFARVNAVISMKVKDYWCACMRRAARSTRFPATTCWRNTSMSMSPLPRSLLTLKVRYSARPAGRMRCGNRAPTG